MQKTADTIHILITIFIMTSSLYAIQILKMCNVYPCNIALTEKKNIEKKKKKMKMQVQFCILGLIVIEQQ